MNEIAENYIDDCTISADLGLTGAAYLLQKERAEQELKDIEFAGKQKKRITEY